MQYPSFVRASSGDAQLSLGEPMNASRDDKESGAACCCRHCYLYAASVIRRKSKPSFYKYFRDYDPATGRYVESDPIGLHGGSFSPYAYVGDNPVANKDPLGIVLIVAGNTPAEQTALQNALNTVAST